MMTRVGFSRATAFFLFAAFLSGCNTTHKETHVGPVKPIAAKSSGKAKQVYYYTAADRECLKRAMYFESKRTSKQGFMAVGTVIMNRMTSGAYPDTICDVVAQEKQFAPGVMTRPMDQATAPDLESASESILRGERNAEVKEAMFFHTDGLSFPYSNMSYVTVAGGNAFYEKRGRDGELQTPEPMAPGEYVMAYADRPKGPMRLVPTDQLEMATPEPENLAARPAPARAPVDQNVAETSPATPAAPAVGEAKVELAAAPVPQNVPVPVAAPASAHGTPAMASFVPVSAPFPAAPGFEYAYIPQSVPVPERRPTGRRMGAGQLYSLQ